MLAPKVGGGWSEERLTTGDALTWLKQVAFQLGFNRTDELGTHSCKRTLLAAIAAKAGMSFVTAPSPWWSHACG